MKKTIKNIVAVILFVVVALCGVLVLPKAAISAKAAGGAAIEVTSSLTDIKTNAAGQEFTVSATVKNNTGTDMHNAEIKISFDVNYFEFVEHVPSPDIRNSILVAPVSSAAEGYITLMGDDKDDPISKTQWKIGSIKLKLKSGFTPSAGMASAITSSDSILCDVDTFDAIEHTLTGANIPINFVQPSNACDITELSINKQKLTASGTSFACTVPYSYSKLSDISVKVSAGAKADSLSGRALNVGANNFTITVTAEDGTTNKTYNLTVTRTAGETVNTLSALQFKNGSDVLLSKDAAALATAGTYDAGDIAFADKDSLRIEFTKNGSFSKVDIVLDGNKLGNTVTTATSGCNLGTLAAGAHTLTIKVMPEDGSAANEYKVTFTVIGAESDVTLSELSIFIKKDNGDLEPVNFTEAFSPSKTTYSASVPQGTAKVKVEAEAAGSLATVDGLGEYSVPCSISVKVTAQNGDSNTYTIIVSVMKDTSGLTLSNVSVVGVDENGGETELVVTETSVADYYRVSIPFTLEIKAFKIKADKFSDPDYKVEGINYDVEIDRAEKSKKHVVRFIKNDVVEKTIIYDIIYESNVKTLAELYCNGVAVDLTSGKNYFLLEVKKETEKAIIEPKPTDVNATVTVISVLKDEGVPVSGKREVSLSGGINPILISVKATNGEEGIYVLCLLRPVGAQTLTSLKCDDVDLDVSDNTKIIEHKVGANVDSIKITAGAIEGATVTLFDREMNEVPFGESVSLKGGDNAYLIKVTADDGTVSAYMLNVNREGVDTGVDAMPYIVAIIVISVVAVLVIISLTVVIIVTRRRG